jgi:hypothetical protein
MVRDMEMLWDIKGLDNCLCYLGCELWAIIQLEGGKHSKPRDDVGYHNRGHS